MVNEPKRNILEGIENTGDVHLHDHRLRLKQRFDIIRKLGQGTYGKVQLGINKKTGQEVAIKTIKKCKIETEADLVRLRREVQIMSSVRHPNIIHIYEVFENSEKMILVMEYCSGGELYDYLSQRKVLQEDEARRLFRQIATAVYYCHKHKICHRDLKLENVLLDEHGSAKIADFGLSNVFEEKRLLSTFCGSPLYASPEIVKGTPYIGPEVDCWSLGVLLYTLVYGAMPFDGSNFKRLVKQISTGDYFEPKFPSSASPLIRDMLTVDPIQRADITHICDHPWVNKGSDVPCLELAEALANETPVRLDLLLSLAPPPVSDKLVVTDEATATGPDGSPGRSMSIAAIDASAERRILEMVAEGGTDAIKPSPTRTIMGAEQPKRKLETTVSMDNAPSQRKKERFLRSSSKVDNVGTQQNEISITPVENNVHIQELQKDVSMVEQNNAPNETSPKAPSPVASKQKVLKTPTKEIVKPAPAPIEPEPENVVSNQATNNHIGSSSPVKAPTVNSQSKKESKPEIKPRDSVLKEKNAVTKPSVPVKKKITSLTSKSDDKKVTKSKEKSPPRKSLEKDTAKKSGVEENNKADAQSIKQPTERRKSRILDAAEKLNNLTIQPAPVSPPPVASPPPVKPKKVLIPGVSVGSFKEQFERRASLTSGAPVIEKKAVKAPGQTTPNKTLADKKMHSVDSEHPVTTSVQKLGEKEPITVKLQNIGIEPSQQAEVVSPSEPESPKKPSVPASEHVTSVVNNNKVLKPLHKSESLREPNKKESITNSISLEDARKSLQHSIALLNQAKGDHQPSKGAEENNPEVDRQTKLKTAREIISNAIGDENNTEKKVQRICMGGKPPVPYGGGGRSASGSLSLSSLGGSPPTSPPHQSVTSPSATPPRTYRTEVQHKLEDVRNKFLPTRGGSIERIIPIHLTSDLPGKTQPAQQSSPSHSTQLPYQRNNSMPYRLSSVPRTTSVQHEPERESSQPPTPFTPLDSPRAEPIKKSPREFIIPIAVEGVGYVTPRQGSLEPSDTPTKLPSANMPFGSRFPKPRRLSSLVSGGESEDEDDMHMHRLRSSRRVRNDAEKDSVSSGEEDEDEEGFELLTAENLFSTLLDRVRNLTNRLNGEEGTGFPQRHQSLFNNLHSPFFNSPHLPRKHNKHSVIREGPSWRRSTSRDISSDFDSMFPAHTTFPRGSRRSSRKGSKHNGDQQQSSHTSEQHNRESTASTQDDTQYPNEHLDLSDLDLSKIELTEKEVETLSGLTPGLSRRLQRQLLSRLPPAAARSLRRTLSAHLPPNHHPHVYSRSLSASKTDPLSCTSPTGGESECEVQHKDHIIEDDEESSVSYNSARSFAEKEFKESSDKYSDVSDINSTNNDRSYQSVCIAERSKSPSVGESLTPHVSSSSKQTPDRSVLGKYLSPDRITVEKFPLTNDYEYTSLLSEPNYMSTYGASNSAASSIPIGGSLRRRSLRTPPIENNHRRISRFLRPDFFDTPHEESIYVKEKKEKELETQKVLKEIRQKKLRPNDSYVSSPTSPSVAADISQMFESCNARNSVSPLGNTIGREKSRSITPFYPSLDNISEHHVDQLTRSSFRNALLDINKHCTDDTPLIQPNLNNTHINNGAIKQQQYKESQIIRPKSYPSKPIDNIHIQNIDTTETKLHSNQKTTPMESKLLRPKSYPSTSPSPEKFTGILPKPNVNCNTGVDESKTSKENDFDKQNISVSFNVSIPSKPLNKIDNENEENSENHKLSSSTVQSVAPSTNHTSNTSKLFNGVEIKPPSIVSNVSMLNNVDITTNTKKSTSKENSPIKSSSPVTKTTLNVQPQSTSVHEKPTEKKSESPLKTDLTNGTADTTDSPPKELDKNSSEDKKKKTILKKKIIVKKKGTIKKTDATKPTEKSPEAEEQTHSLVKEQKSNEEKISPKKKSVLHSIGERFEKFRNDSFNKGASQEKEIVNETKTKERLVPAKEEKSSRIENVIRALRERSVPNNNTEEQATESGLIKRAVTITDLPTLDAKASSSKKTVNKVLGLFKKADTKDNKSDTKYIVNGNKCDENKINQSETTTTNNCLIVDKPKRPTSLLLNGIGRRVQACYNGATSDSVLVNENNQSTREKTPVGQMKNEETKSQKKGLRLDFSKLPKLNQSLFNKRNSQDMSKSRESSLCKESSVEPQEVTNNNESSNKTIINNGETPLSPCLDNNGNSTLSTATSSNWSPDYDCSKFMVSPPTEHDMSHSEHHIPHRHHEATSPDPENIEDRIRRKSFYSRFNEKKNKRKSLLVGPGAKEYNPTERIHSHPDSENNVYYNRYDFSPTNSSKSDKTADFSKYSDRSECLSPKYKSNNEPLSPYSYKSLDRNDRKYLMDPPYQPYVEKTSQYSIPRYSRTLSMHDNNNFDTKLSSTAEPKKNSMRYGRSFSLLSPGNYNTYNPRTHSRNSAILLRDDTETEPYTTENILTKIRNRKKLLAASPTTDDEDYLDSKYRSNIHSASNNEHDASDDKVES